MNIVKITNKIALASVVLLMYWVFIFVCTTVFGFKVFRENITEMFLLSILGIFAVLMGSIILNIMYNLTAIAEGRQTQKKYEEPNKKLFAFFIGSLIAIFGLLFFGDRVTSNNKEEYLVSAASDLVKEQSSIVTALSDYSFSKEYLKITAQNISLLSRIEEKFPQVIVIARDSVHAKPLLLGFGAHFYLAKDQQPEKTDYILGTSSEERRYLNSVFDGERSDYKFSSNDGQYEIYFPVTTEKGLIVLHLSQHSRYGKIGS